MPNTALVTGASSGIGKELARIHAGNGGNLVIVARREQALEELKSELERKYQINVTCIGSDLSETDAAKKLYDQLEAQNIEVDMLINNAGFGGHGKFHERDWTVDRDMIQLNVAQGPLAITCLTRASGEE